MNRLVTGAVVPLLIAFLSSARAEEKLAPAPTPRMELAKVGPRTEELDLKAYAQVLHVAPSGSDQGDASPAKPLATIAQALSKISDAREQKRYAVIVAAGEYRGDTIAMKPFVDLFGGFDANAWKRDILASPSVLDGEQTRRVVVGADHARIDGFVIRNGKVRGLGAGILCDHASPTISNNTIVHNATLKPEGLVERKMIHQHANDGGGVACINGSNSTITNNVIACNTTEIGGGAGIGVNNMSLPRITGNVICDNHAGIADVDRSRCNNGGGISASHAPHRPPLRMTIANNVIVNNRCGGNSDGGGIYLEYDSSPLVAANWILGNLAEDDGGGIYILKLSHPDVIGNIVAGSKGSSGITLSKEGRGNFENNFIYANPCGITCPESWMLLKHNTIVANQGPAIAYRQAKHWKPAVVTENIIYGNAGDVQIDGGSVYPLIVTRNDIQGGHAGEGNFDEPISFGNDRLTGTASSVQYDARRTQTTLTTAEIGSGERVVGRTIRLGDKWGLVKSFADGKVVVWGDLRTPNPETRFEIPMSYVLRGAAPRGVGATWEKL